MHFFPHLVGSNAHRGFGFGCLKRVLFDSLTLQLAIQESILSGYDLQIHLFFII